MSQKGHLVRTPFFIATLALTTLSIAQEQKSPPTTRPSNSTPNPLHQEMESIGRDFKQIRAQVSDPAKNQSTLDLLQDMERQTLAAKSSTPRTAATRPESERPKFLNDYRTDIVNMLRLELELEENLLDNHNDKATQSVQDLVNLMDQAHKEFRPKRQRQR